MCGRYGLSHTRKEIEDFFNVSIPEPYTPRYNIAPTQPILIIRENRHIPAGIEATHVVWGLIPPWASDIKIGQKMINARCETAAEKPSFRHALKRRRCIVPVSGFYEWQRIEGADGKVRKQPYMISNADKTPMALAGLWEIWDGPNGEQIESATILTTTANELLAPMHDRMPVIIQSYDIPTWLDTLNEDVREISNLLRSAPAEALNIIPVSSVINRADGYNLSPPPSDQQPLL